MCEISFMYFPSKVQICVSECVFIIDNMCVMICDEGVK